MTTYEKYGECMACGRTIARKRIGRTGPYRSKAHVRHKCPHGVLCITGKVGGAIGFNGPSLAGEHYCSKCVAAYDSKWKLSAESVARAVNSDGLAWMPNKL